MEMATFKRAHFDLLPGSPKAQDVTNLSELVSYNAQHNPSHLFCLQGVRDHPPVRLSFADLEIAVQACSAWLLDVLDLDGEAAQAPRPGVALFMDSDISILVHVAAIIRCNLKCVLLSARLSRPGLERLVRATEVRLVLASPRLEALAREASSPLTNGHAHLNGTTGHISVRTALGFSRFLHADGEIKVDSVRSAKQLQMTARWKAGRDDCVVFLHSSGSTGLPKPIGLANAYLLGYAACHEFPESSDESTTGIVASTLPLFHGFGLLPPCLSLGVGKPCFLPPVSVVPGAALVASMLQEPLVTALMTVPSILEDVVALKNFDWESMRRLDFVAVGGGAMKLATGLYLQDKGVTILNHFGATELGALAPIFRPGREYDWRYLRLRQDMGLALSSEGSGSEGEQIVKLRGQPFGWDIPFELQDRMERNSASLRPELRLLGRTDDLIVLATGEKVSPNAFEQAVVESPLVSTAVLFGENQLQLGLLIEPSPAARQLNAEDLRAELWHVVVAQNATADSHAQISSANAMLLVPSDKAIPRSDKGSFQRKAVYAAFETEIAAFYQMLEQDGDTVNLLHLPGHDLGADVAKLAAVCIRGLDGDSKAVSERDFMELGMDSLGLARFRRLLRGYVKNNPTVALSSDLINNEFVYSNPSVASVTEALAGRGPAVSEEIGSMQTLVQQYSDQICQNLSPQMGLKYEILLTGATGTLGAQIVRTLTRNPEVGSVICLLRRQASAADEHSQDQLKRAMALQQISLSSEQWAKVQTHYWTPGEECLGLNSEEYTALAEKITHIIHGAWPMNFAMKLSSYGVHVKACADLVQLAKAAHDCRQHVVPRLVFVSSISTVGSSTSVPVRESLPAPQDTLPMGYAKAKWVCEGILENASKCLQGRVEVTTARVGQMVGPEESALWNQSEHMARIIKASKAIGSLPRLSGTASWLPADRAANVVVDILLATPPPEPFYHVENPVRQAWSALLQAFKYQSSLATAGEVEYDQWLAQARPYLEGLEDFLDHHFIRMATGAIVLDTTATRRISPTLASSGAVSLDTVRAYVRAWEKSGFLQ